jgi:hypothetical protein
MMAEGEDGRVSRPEFTDNDIRRITATVMTWRLKALVDAPTEVGGQVLALRYLQDKTKHGGTFSVKGIR